MQGVIANAKHYMNNNQELNRNTVSANVDERTRMEVAQARGCCCCCCGGGGGVAARSWHARARVLRRSITARFRVLLTAACYPSC